MRLIALFIAALTMFSSGASAAQSCYGADQLEAEQGLRIHSELMVIALNCQHLAGGANLYRQYENFTNKNIGLIENYEKTMMNFFQNEGAAKPEKALNDFRTALANRISKEAVRLQPNVFCRAYSSRITQANNMDITQFRTWAQTVFDAYPLTRPICQGLQVRKQAR